MKRRSVLAGLSAAGLTVGLGGSAQSAARPPMRYTYLAAVGRRIIGYRQESPAGAVVAAGSFVEAPEAVQSCWQHPVTRILYVASSGQSTGQGRHFLSAFTVSPWGQLAAVGPDVALAARPIFMTLDNDGRFVLSAYNRPGMVTAHQIRPDGGVGAMVEQVVPLDLGAYPHQVRLFPSNRSVLVPARGNDATPSTPEDPGALHVLGFDNGQFSRRQVIAPHQGLNYRPRHADFHPSGRWAYLDLESQNAVETYEVRGDQLSPLALFSSSTLRNPAPAASGQLTSAIQVHPDGRTLYVANRGTGTVRYLGEPVANGGENTIAVFAINPRTGEPILKQSIDIDGVHARTFCITPDGAWLTAATVRPAKVRIGDRVATVAAGLSVFKIAANGRLKFHSKVAVDVGSDSLFWVGAVRH